MKLALERKDVDGVGRDYCFAIQIRREMVDWCCRSCCYSCVVVIVFHTAPKFHLYRTS